MVQDPNVVAWGALDRYQAHYIVSAPGENDSNAGLFVRTVLETTGHFASKRVAAVRWEGSSHPLLALLNGDGQLNAMIARRSVWDATIHIEYTDSGIRIHGRWNDGATFGVDEEMFEIYDRIAGHVKASCLPPVQ